MNSIILGICINILNFVLFFISLKLAEIKINKFNNYYFGGFTIRFILTIILLFIILNFTNIDKIYFVISFLIFTFVLKITEIYIVIKRRQKYR